MSDPDQDFVGMSIPEMYEWQRRQPMLGEGEFEPSPEDRLGHYGNAQGIIGGADDNPHFFAYDQETGGHFLKKPDRGG